MKHTTMKKEYRDLEMMVLSSLREKINKSEYRSKHITERAIKVNIFDYTEMVIVNDKLTFLDKNGLHYSIFSDCSIEDLIDILATLHT